MALLVGVALAQSCTPAVKKQRPVSGIHVYLFGAELHADSLICVERPFAPDPDCLTLERLRRMVRETAAD